MEGYSGTAKNAVLRLPRQNTTQIEIYVYCDISIQILPKMMKKYYHVNIKTLHSKIIYLCKLNLKKIMDSVKPTLIGI